MSAWGLARCPPRVWHPPFPATHLQIKISAARPTSEAAMYAWLVREEHLSPGHSGGLDEQKLQACCVAFGTDMPCTRKRLVPFRSGWGPVAPTGRFAWHGMHACLRAAGACCTHAERALPLVSTLQVVGPAG